MDSPGAARVDTGIEAEYNLHNFAPVRAFVGGVK